GGFDPLLFCIAGRRVTPTTQTHYRFLCEGLCKSRVPIALFITRLEREGDSVWRTCGPEKPSRIWRYMPVESRVQGMCVGSDANTDGILRDISGHLSRALTSCAKP
ncbi:hypothetical protein PAXINDRAFT_69265, partial [Paxillus involutus ATCC 200175]